MFDNTFEYYLENIYDELIDSDDKEIQKQLKKILKGIPEENYRHELLPFIHFLAMEIVPMSPNDDLVRKTVKEYAKLLELRKKTIRIRVFPECLPEVYRVLELPYMITLDDMAMYILAAFRSFDAHMYFMRIGGEQCAWVDGFEIVLDELKLKKGSIFEMTYDFDNDMTFIVEVEAISKKDEVVERIEGKILDGKGYGIIEDSQHLTELYYKNHKLFMKEIDELGISDLFDEDMILPAFNLEEANEELVGSFLTLIEELDEFEDDALDDLDFEDFDDAMPFDDPVDFLS